MELKIKREDVQYICVETDNKTKLIDASLKDNIAIIEVNRVYNIDIVRIVKGTTAKIQRFICWLFLSVLDLVTFNSFNMTTDAISFLSQFQQIYKAKLMVHDNRGNCSLKMDSYKKVNLPIDIVDFAGDNNCNATLEYEKTVNNKDLKREFRYWCFESFIIVMLWEVIFSILIVLSIKYENHWLIQYFIAAIIPAAIVLVRFLVAIYRNYIFFKEIQIQADYYIKESYYLGETPTNICLRNKSNYDIRVRICDEDTIIRETQIGANSNEYFNIGNDVKQLNLDSVDSSFSKNIRVGMIIRNYFIVLVYFILGFVLFSKHIINMLGFKVSKLLSKKKCILFRLKEGKTFELIYEVDKLHSKSVWKVKEKNNDIVKINDEKAYNTDEVNMLYKQWKIEIIISILIYFVISVGSVLLGMRSSMNSIAIPSLILCVIGIVESIKLYRNNCFEK